MFDDCFEERRHVFAVLVQLAHGEAVLCARIDDREIELLVGRFQLDEKIKHEIENLVRPRIFAVDLVDDDNRLGFVFERLSQHETRLGLRAIVRVHHEQNAVHHLHDPLDFAAEIGVARRVDDVDPVTVPLKRGVLRPDRDPLLTFEVHRIHHPVLYFLVRAESSGLAQQLIHERGLAVVDVRNDGDITNLVHGTNPRD